MDGWKCSFVCISFAGLEWELGKNMEYVEYQLQQGRRFVLECAEVAKSCPRRIYSTQVKTSSFLYFFLQIAF